MPFLALYRAAHNNAIELIQEAEILFERGRYCRAYALAFTALEEISKSQLAADVFTGLISRETFQKAYRDHREKIARMAWATEDAKHYLSAPDGEYLEVEAPTFPSRSPGSGATQLGNTSFGVIQDFDTNDTPRLCQFALKAQF
jgi:AbiV family abortive infection protein